MWRTVNNFFYPNKTKVQLFFKIIFHSIPKELSTRDFFNKYTVQQLTIEKTIDLNQKKKPCFHKHENVDGENFGQNEYKVLSKKVQQLFNCSTPFLPGIKETKEIQICKNETVGMMVHEFLKTSASFHTTTIWSPQFHSYPPCVYHKFSLEEKISSKGETEHLDCSSYIGKLRSIKKH